MKTTIILNGVSVERNVPVCWEDVTFKQLLELDKCGQDIVKVISLFTQTDYDTLRRSKIVDMDKVIAVLGFLKTPAVPALPKTILGYPVPVNLEFEQVQQYIDLKNYITEAQKKTGIEQLESYALYCAVYACKPYDWERAEKMKDIFLQAPCTEVLGIGNFTLLKMIGLKNNIDPTSQTPDSLRKKFRLVLAGWRIRMVLFFRSFNLRKKLV